jgi:regulator of sirC expression with transglutaminase-like and TPR domain
MESHDKLSQTRMLKALQSRPPRLDLAALAIASIEYPDLEPTRYEKTLDQYAARAGDDIDRLCQVLAKEEGFRGNTSDYYGPQNSCLNVVLDTRVGLPLTLSVVYLEVARRAGIALYGVAFPGHFVVACDFADHKLVIDPFHSGQTLNQASCAELVRRAAPGARFSTNLIAPASPEGILQRMLTNLKGSYLRNGDGGGALKAIDHLLALSPDDPGELRSRAAIFSALGGYRAALADVERCLELSPAGPEHDSLVDTAKTLRDRAKYMN